MEDNVVNDVRLADLVTMTLGSGRQRPLPDWARWFVELGAIQAAHRGSEDLTTWTVVTVPRRNFVAPFIAYGAVLQKLLMESTPNVEDRFRDRFEGSYLTWIDHNEQIRFGRFDGLRDSYIHYRPRKRGGWSSARTSRPLSSATSFWPADEYDEFVEGRAATQNRNFVAGVVKTREIEFLSRSRTDAVLIGTKSHILSELSSEVLSAGGVTGALLDVVRPQDALPVGQRHRSLLFSSNADPSEVEGAACDATVIFDGPSAFLALRDSVDTNAAVVVLERWESRADVAAQAAILDRRESAVSAQLPAMPPAPAGVEVFAWVGER